MSITLTFEQAQRKMPRSICGGLDPLQHKTVEDLAWLTQHGLDLYAEGEPNAFSGKGQVESAKRYFKLLTGRDYEH